MLRVEGITVAYGTHVAVRGLTLDAADNEVVCVLGPSGCGKSTLLRAIAGLEMPTTGTIELDGQPLQGKRPDQRAIGLMFQDQALFPHRSVGDNVAFGPRMRGLAPTDVAHRVRDALALVDLSGTEQRPVTQLSGGEQQRVALARAIAPRPRLLMLDEPLGSLDRALRDRLLDDLPKVFARLGTTVLYVTHDQDEALVVADRVAVMRAGSIEQEGSPDQLWREPRTEFVARFLGLEHVMDAEVEDGVATTLIGAIPVRGGPDGRARVVLLGDALRVTTDLRPLGPDEIAIVGTVFARRFAGDHLRIRVRSDAGVEFGVPVWRGNGPEVGASVELALDPAGVRRVETGAGDRT